MSVRSLTGFRHQERTAGAISDCTSTTAPRRPLGQVRRAEAAYQRASPTLPLLEALDRTRSAPGLPAFQSVQQGRALHHELLATRSPRPRNPSHHVHRLPLSSRGNDLAALAKRGWIHPNLFVDISARDYETPRRHGREISGAYRQRIVGNGHERRGHVPRLVALAKARTSSSPGGCGGATGLELQAPVLRASVRNARRILNWRKSQPWGFHHSHFQIAAVPRKRPGSRDGRFVPGRKGPGLVYVILFQEHGSNADFCSPCSVSLSCGRRNCAT